MRLFFALWPDERVRNQLVCWRKEFRAVCGGRPVADANLHLTLVFLGTVDEARVAEVERAAASVTPRSFTLTLDRPGWWKKNHIAWAGASQTLAELDALVSELRDSLTRAGIDFNAGSDKHGFVSHVTLLRDAHEPEALPVFEKIEWKVRSFALVRSVTQPGGSEYRVLREWVV